MAVQHKKSEDGRPKSWVRETVRDFSCARILLTELRGNPFKNMSILHGRSSPRQQGFYLRLLPILILSYKSQPALGVNISVRTGGLEAKMMTSCVVG
jgi:hypothetical protein